MNDRLGELVEAADLNALLRAVDNLCETRDWDALVELAERCEDALERGKQLWPIVAHVDYRLALEAPADVAASVLGPEAGRFAFGPLTEVIASHHTWDELAPHFDLPQSAAYVAQERVLRGEVLDDDERARPEVLELPLHLEEWEPGYPLPIYRSNSFEVPEPWDPRAPLSDATFPSAEVVERPDATSALLDLVTPWTTESNGGARAVAVAGPAHAAAGALTFGRLRMGPLEPAEAVQRMAWAAASGGAHGRRRGGALGRWLAWYTASVLADTRWPVPADELRAGIERLRWYRWDEGDVEEGWVLRLAVEDPDGGWAVALGATDLLSD